MILATFIGIVLTHWVLVGALLAKVTIVAVSYWLSIGKGDIGGVT